MTAQAGSCVGGAQPSRRGGEGPSGLEGDANAARRLKEVAAQKAAGKGRTDGRTDGGEGRGDGRCGGPEAEATHAGPALGLCVRRCERGVGHEGDTTALAAPPGQAGLLSGEHALLVRGEEGRDACP